MPRKDPDDWRTTYHRRRARTSGSLPLLRKKLWFWISTCDKEMRDAILVGDTHTVARMAHACNQLASSYYKLVFGDELAERVLRLERSRSGHAPHVISMEQWEGMHRNGE